MKGIPEKNSGHIQATELKLFCPGSSSPVWRQAVYALIYHGNVPLHFSPSSDYTFSPRLVLRLLLFHASRIQIVTPFPLGSFPEKEKVACGLGSVNKGWQKILWDRAAASSSYGPY